MLIFTPVHVNRRVGPPRRTPIELIFCNRSSFGNCNKKIYGPLLNERVRFLCAPYSPPPAKKAFPRQWRNERYCSRFRNSISLDSWYLIIPCPPYNYVNFIKSILLVYFIDPSGCTITNYLSLRNFLVIMVDSVPLASRFEIKYRGNAEYNNSITVRQFSENLPNFASENDAYV